MLDRTNDDPVRGHIEIVDSPHGPKARIAGHSIRVQDVAIWHEKLGMSPDEIIDQYPTITLADVYAALAYYWDHRDAIEQEIAEDQRYAEEFRKTAEPPLRERLKRALRG